MVGRLRRRVSRCFNPHPISRPGATGVHGAVEDSQGSFNPHPISRPGATCARRIATFFPSSFNPHPISRPGATSQSKGSSSPSWCFNPHPISRPGATRLTRGDRLIFVVSILTRSHDRVQRAILRPPARVGVFQSSPDLTTGCNSEFVVSPITKR